jgi:3D (Asp-Asp-Asp) domain-containing protein
MNQKTIKAVNALFLAAFMFTAQGVACLPLALDDHKPQTIKILAKSERFLLRPEEPEEIRPLPTYYEAQQNKFIFDHVTVGYTFIELEYLGSYFITAYCPEECGWSWETSSGATCHYSDDWATPTTCAIDRNYHGYWETLQVGDPDDPNKKIYMTEDTGPGVRGRWVDCFVETMDEVQSWPTRWDSVYAVEYGSGFITPNERKRIHELINPNLLNWSSGAGFSGWHDPGIDN